MLETDLALLERAARGAGEIAMSYWRKAPRYWDKAVQAGPVSIADLAVNTYLEELLRDARPDYGWLSEESADDRARLGAKRCFIIDPIDGTRAFLEEQQGFSHSLAISDGSRIIAAAVHLPALDLTYLAAADGPATLNGQKIDAVDTELDGAMVLANKLTFLPDRWQGNRLPPIKRNFRTSLAWRLCLVAAGRFNATLSLSGAWEWDIAAGSLIAERAGCLATDATGQPMQFNARHPRMRSLAVAPPGLHAALLSRLAL